MTNPFALQERAGGYETAVHGDKLSFGPKCFRFLPNAVEGFEIGGFVHEFGDDADLEGVITSLAQEISVVFNDIGMVLHFAQLLCLLLKFIKFVEGLRFDLLQRVKLASGNMNCLVNLSVLLA